MSDVVADIGQSLRNRNRADWTAEVQAIVAPRGTVSRLGRRHLSIYRPGGVTLLVGFETLQGIQTLSPRGHPMGWQLFERYGWSTLSLVSEGDTWFRNRAVYNYFDQLVDKGFFDAFERVLFFGAGACGYAAAAFSVSAPGARVLAIQPQATLAPDLTEWDHRFPDQSRVNFTDRYGYAPDMIEAASRAFIAYDPLQPEDAMHATLFTRPNVTKLRLRRMGSMLLTDLFQMGVIYDVIEACAQNLLTERKFAELMRARRDHLPYLRRLLAHLDREERDGLARMLCHNVSARMRAPLFAKRLQSQSENND
ncbi:MAG: phosphoadenosine phosphosulfate reductase [Pseudomonadota bacterium]